MAPFFFFPNSVRHCFETYGSFKRFVVVFKSVSFYSVTSPCTGDSGRVPVQSHCPSALNCSDSLPWCSSHTFLGQALHCDQWQRLKLCHQSGKCIRFVIRISFWSTRHCKGWNQTVSREPNSDNILFKPGEDPSDLLESVHSLPTFPWAWTTAKVIPILAHSSLGHLLFLAHMKTLCTHPYEFVLLGNAFYSPLSPFCKKQFLHQGVCQASFILDWPLLG